MLPAWGGGWALTTLLLQLNLPSQPEVVLGPDLLDQLLDPLQTQHAGHLYAAIRDPVWT